MVSARQLLGASILSLVAAAGCGQAGSTETNTASADDIAAVGSSAAAVEADARTTAATDQAAGPPVDAPPVRAVETTAALPVEEPDATRDAAAAAESTGSAPAPPAATLATESPSAAGAAATADPGGTLIASVGATDVAAVPAGPREPTLLIPEKSFRKEGDALRVTYDDIDLLKVLNMEPVTPNAPELFPQWLKNLEGQRIRIRGYMRPGELSENIPFFVLARDTQACCFGPNTKAYDIIPVIMRDGVTTDYIHLQPFDVVGEFHIGVEMDFANPDKVEFLYRIEDAVLIRK